MMQGSRAETDGGIRVDNHLGKLVAKALLLEVKEKEGDASFQTLGYAAGTLLSSSKERSPAFTRTCLPTLALELLGHTFR